MNPGLDYTILLPNPLDCSTFYSCSGGVPILMFCPPGLLFNDKLDVCDWPQNVDCIPVPGGGYNMGCKSCLAGNYACTFHHVEHDGGVGDGYNPNCYFCVRGKKACITHGVTTAEEVVVEGEGKCSKCDRSPCFCCRDCKEFQCICKTGDGDGPEPEDPGIIGVVPGGGGDDITPKPEEDEESDEEVKVTLKVPAQAELMSSYSITVTVTPESTVVNNVDIYFHYDIEDSEPLYSGESLTYTRTAIKPGYWKVKAVVQTPDGEYSSVVKEVSEVYPGKETILTHVRSEFDALWQQTKTFATNNKSTHTVQEFGGWVWLDTSTGVYSVESRNDVETTPIALTQDNVDNNGNITVFTHLTRPRDDYRNSIEPTKGGKFYVACFHTHFPICYAAIELSRTGGPTNPIDYDSANYFNVPGFVYDYTRYIERDHDIEAAAKPWSFGLNRRKLERLF